MRTGKILLLGTGCTVALLACAVGVVFSSSFQTWMVRRMLAGQPGIEASIGRISLGLNHIELENLRLRKDGVLLEIPALTAELSLVAAAQKDVRINRIVAKGWRIDLEASERKPEGGKPGATTVGSGAYAPIVPLEAVRSVGVQAPRFLGVFPRLKIPVALSVEQADLSGEVSFGVRGSKDVGRVAVLLTGGQLGVGRDAVFELALVAAARQDAPVTHLGAKGRLRVSMDTPQSIDKVAVEIAAEASGGQLQKGAKLELRFGAAQKAGAEVYDVELGTTGKKMIEAHTEYEASGGRLKGSWKLDLQDEVLIPFVMGAALPRFSVCGEGRLNAELGGAEVQLSGVLDARLDQLKVLRPELEPLGALRGRADFDLAYRDKGVRVTKLLLNLDGQKAVLRVEALQGFEYGLETSELRIADPARDLVRCELLGVPLAWMRPWTGEFLVEGSDLSAVFTLAAREGGLIVRGDVPARVDNLTVTRGRQTLVKNLGLSALVSGDFSPQRWQFVVQDLTARGDRIPVFWFKGRAGRLAGAGQPIKAEGKWLVQLPELLEQPVAAKTLDLKRGRMSCDFSASLGTKQEVQADVRLTELVAGVSGDTELPNVTARLRADRSSDGMLAVQVPIQLVAKRDSRTSDLQINGKMFPREKAVEVDIAVLSQHLVLEDLQCFAAVVPGSTGSRTIAAQAPRTPSPDMAPFWAGLAGKITLALKSVNMTKDLELKDVAGTIRVDGGTFKMDGVQATLPQGATVVTTTTMRFDAKAAEPYSLGGDVKLDNLESASMVSKSTTVGNPSIQASFDVDANVQGTGRTVAELFEQTHGSFVMTSKSGTCRLLRADVSESVKGPQKGASIVGNIGAMLGSDRLTNYAVQVQTVAQIAKALEEVNFDQLSVTVMRDAERNIRLQEFTLISPQLRLGGSGEIRHVNGASLEERPMDLRLQLGVRGDLAGMMTKVGLLDGRQDNLGYQGFAAPVRIGGTLRQPDNGDLEAILTKAATGSLLNRLLKR